MKKGDWINTPRFCGVEILKVFRSKKTAFKAAVYYALSRHSRTSEQDFCGVYVYVSNGDAVWHPFYGIIRNGAELCNGRKCQ